MESMGEASVGVPTELWTRLETAAANDCASPAAVLSEALIQHLSRRVRLRAASLCDGARGDFDELAEVDPALDVTGCA